MRAASTLRLVDTGEIGSPLIFDIRTRVWPRGMIIVLVRMGTESTIDMISNRFRKGLV